MSKFVELLENLGRDAELAAAYEKDPQSVLDQYDLTEEERKAMLDRDVDAVRKLSGLASVRMTNSTIKTHE